MQISRILMSLMIFNIVFDNIIYSQEFEFFDNYFFKILKPIYSCREVEFRVISKNAENISIFGDFNNYKKSDIYLEEKFDNYFSVKIKLPPGNYEFQFYVDDKKVIPKQPFDIFVSKDNRVYDLRPKISRNRVEFPYGLLNAKSMYLIGNFNNWDKAVDKMKKIDENVFSITKTFKSGDYKYQFVANGKYIYPIKKREFKIRTENRIRLKVLDNIDKYKDSILTKEVNFLKKHIKIKKKEIKNKKLNKDIDLDFSGFNSY